MNGYRWIPEEICGRAKLEKQPFSISFPTIYRAIDDGILSTALKKIMRFKWEHKKCKSEDKRGKTPNTVSIHDRPAGAENRSRYGHWESDSVLGQQNSLPLSTVKLFFKLSGTVLNALIVALLKARGTNENTNGLLRQFFPKKTSFAAVTDDDLATVVSLINNRPRKRLGYRTHAEVLKKFFL